MKRPNYTNKLDACCCCNKTGLPTPQDHEQPAAGELLVWQPNPGDPPQWICSSCHERLTAEISRS